MTRILPPVAVLELTYRCNHACRFCSCPWFGGMMTPTPEMDVAEWKRLIAAYAEIGVTQFSFTGGEALMKEGCLELLGFAAARCSVGLLSNGRLRVCNHSPVELVRWDEWERLGECEEWLHYMRHDYLPAACSGCSSATRCLGGCREAARVFRGSPLAPDPVCETVKPK